MPLLAAAKSPSLIDINPGLMFWTLITFVVVLVILRKYAFGPIQQMIEARRAAVTADLDAAYAYLNGLPAVRTGDIGTIGFCWGGGQSFRYATNNPNLRAVVVCYGPPPDTATMRRIQAPVLGVYGENDERIDATLPTVVAAMQSDGKTFNHEVYPGTGHGFLKPGRQGSDGPQVERAWKRILEFYRARLGK